MTLMDYFSSWIQAVSALVPVKMKEGGQAREGFSSARCSDRPGLPSFTFYGAFSWRNCLAWRMRGVGSVPLSGPELRCWSRNLNTKAEELAHQGADQWNRPENAYKAGKFWLNCRLQDFSVRRGSPFKVTLRTTFSLSPPCGGPNSVKIVKWIVLELSVIEPLFTLFG